MSRQPNAGEPRLAAVRDGSGDRRGAGGYGPTDRNDATEPSPMGPAWFRGRVADLRARGESEPQVRRGRHAPQPAHGSADEPAEDPLIRPFLLTGGRTWTKERGLRVESLIRSEPGASAGGLRFEARRIVELAARPTSVAELAVALGLPIGVIRVLVGDLVDSGAVGVVQVEEISLGLLERIRDRVRAL